MIAVRGRGGNSPPPSSTKPASNRAGGVGGEQHAVGQAGIAVTRSSAKPGICEL